VEGKNLEFQEQCTLKAILGWNDPREMCTIRGDKVESHFFLFRDKSVFILYQLRDSFL